MLQTSKILHSREQWKGKAIRRANEVRDLKKSKYRYQKRIEELKSQISQLEQDSEKKKP
jgi:uncharacterized protein YlxW (UPF0749 family)